MGIRSNAAVSLLISGKRCGHTGPNLLIYNSESITCTKVQVAERKEMCLCVRQMILLRAVKGSTTCRSMNLLGRKMGLSDVLFFRYFAASHGS